MNYVSYRIINEELFGADLIGKLAETFCDYFWTVLMLDSITDDNIIRSQIQSHCGCVPPYLDTALDISSSSLRLLANLNDEFFAGFDAIVGSKHRHDPKLVFTEQQRFIEAMYLVTRDRSSGLKTLAKGLDAVHCSVLYFDLEGPELIMCQEVSRLAKNTIDQWGPWESELV